MGFGPNCPNFQDPTVALEHELCETKRYNLMLLNQIKLLLKVIDGKCEFKHIEKYLLSEGFKRPESD